MKINIVMLFAAFLMISTDLSAQTKPPADTLANNIVVPNLFTPNKTDTDGMYHIESLNKSAIIEINMQIFNRWGQQLFELTEIDQGWDGKYKDKDLLDGLYVYHLKAKIHSGNITGQIIEVDKKGAITIFR